MFYFIFSIVCFYYAFRTLQHLFAPKEKKFDHLEFMDYQINYMKKYNEKSKELETLYLQNVKELEEMEDDLSDPEQELREAKSVPSSNIINVDFIKKRIK